MRICSGVALLAASVVASLVREALADRARARAMAARDSVYDPVDACREDGPRDENDAPLNPVLVIGRSPADGRWRAHLRADFASRPRERS